MSKDKRIRELEQANHRLERKVQAALDLVEAVVWAANDRSPDPKAEASRS